MAPTARVSPAACRVPLGSARLLAELLLAFFMTATAALAGAGIATAEPPSRLNERVTDTAGVLGSTSDIDAALADLQDAEGIKLWVVFVATFDGQQPEQWARATYDQSGFGSTDALLAVATEERSYQLTYFGPTFSESELQDVATNDIEPKLSTNDWSAAAVSAAEGLGGAQSSTGGSVLLGVALLVVVLLLIGVPLWLWLRRRKRSRDTAQQAAATDPSDTRALSQFDEQTLNHRARAALVSADQSLRSSQGALAAAQEEFGDIRTREFRDALERASRLVGEGHQLVAELDDAIPESPAQRKQMLLQLADVSGQAEAALHEQTSRFGEMRAALVNGESTVDTLRQRAIAARAQLPAARETLTGLQRQYPEHMLVSLVDNPDLAERLVESAEDELDGARTALDDPSGQQGAAIDHIMHAREALDKTETLLTAVDSAAADIASAQAELPALEAEVRGALGAAEQQLANDALEPQLAEQLRTARTTAQQELDAALAAHDGDPLGTYRRLAAADVKLDRAMGEAGREIANAERIAQAVRASLQQAESAVRDARAFIAARDTVVGQNARTRLAQAEQALTDARAMSDYAAVDAATSASKYAQMAMAAAHSDAQNAQNFQNFGGFGGGGYGGYRGRYYRNSLGADLGGALVRGVLFGVGSSWGAGRFSGGWGGGFSGGGFGGGFSGGDFGGGGSVGGRF